MRCHCEEEHKQSTSYDLHCTFLQSSNARSTGQSPQQDQEPDQNPHLAEARSYTEHDEFSASPVSRQPGSNRRKRSSKPSSATPMGLRSRSSNRADRAHSPQPSRAHCRSTRIELPRRTRSAVAQGDPFVFRTSSSRSSANTAPIFTVQ